MTITTLIAAGAEPWEVDFVRVTAQTPGLALVRRCVDVADAVVTAASGQVQIALLSLDLPGLDTDAVDRIVDSGVHAIAVVAPDAERDLPRALALGMRSVLPADNLDGLESIVEQADNEQDVDTGGRLRATGRVVTVWGPTGAPGRSTVALGIASESAVAGVPTLLVDADVHGGSIAQMLAILDEVSGILAASRSANQGRLTAQELQQHTRTVGPNLRILTGIPRADRWPGLRSGSVRAVLEVARELAALVVVDVGFNLEVDETLSFDTAAPRRNGATLVALEVADQVVAVGSADPLGLTRLTRGVFDLRDAVPGADVSVVINQARSSLGWTQDQVAETVQRFTGLPPSGFLPLDQAAVDTAWLNGRTLAECARDSPLRLGLSALAKQLTVPGFVPSRPRRTGRWSRVH